VCVCVCVCVCARVCVRACVRACMCVCKYMQRRETFVRNTCYILIYTSVSGLTNILSFKAYCHDAIG